MRRLSLKKNETISTDTFFNQFPNSQLKKYTNVKTISLSIMFKGHIEVTVISVDGNTEKTIFKESMQQKSASETQLFTEFNLNEAEDYLYCKIKSLSYSVIDDIIYYDAKPSSLRNSRLTAVICTFNREKYILENIARIQTFLKQNRDWAKMLTVLIIDNAGNLPEQKFDFDIQIIPNKNTGGAGGFTRGLIECLKDSDSSDYCLFMDDDILFDPQQLIDTLQLLQRRKSDLILGSPMLRLEPPYTIIHEKGATVSNSFFPVYHSFSQGVNAELKPQTAATPENVQYGSWWWFAFPLQAVKDVGLPYPFFIKFDDIEYSKRFLEKGYQIAVPENMAVWHEPFHKKKNLIMSYFQWRNSWIYQSLYSQSLPVLHFTMSYLQQIFLFLGAYKYAHIDILNKALADFLSGPLILNQQPSKLLESLSVIALPEQFHQVESLCSMEEQHVKEEKPLRKFLRIILLNAIFLPSFGKIYIDDFSTGKMARSFGHKRIFYYSVYQQKGYWTKKSVFKTLFRLFQAQLNVIKIFMQYKRITREYAKKKNDTCSMKNWISILEL